MVRQYAATLNEERQQAAVLTRNDSIASVNSKQQSRGATPERSREPSIERYTTHRICYLYMVVIILYQMSVPDSPCGLYRQIGLIKDGHFRKFHCIISVDYSL